MEEPICDPPAVALHYVSKLARQHVKVLLSGEGGDEAFGGYNDYRNFLLLERMKGILPFFNKPLAAILQSADRFPAFHKATKFAPYFITAPRNYYYSRAASPFSFFNRNKARFYEPAFRDILQPERSLDVIHRLFDSVCGEPLLNQLQFVDTKTCLPDDLLIKADRMTMGNSLELRVPFLDHKLLEFAARLPPHYKVSGQATKRILKHAFRKHIPLEILRRKKAGFPVPIETWTRRQLRSQVREVLLSKTPRSRLFSQKCHRKIT